MSLMQLGVNSLNVIDCKGNIHNMTLAIQWSAVHNGGNQSTLKRMERWQYGGVMNPLLVGLTGGLWRSSTSNN